MPQGFTQEVGIVNPQNSVVDSPNTSSGIEDLANGLGQGVKALKGYYDNKALSSLYGEVVDTAQKTQGYSQLYKDLIHGMVVGDKKTFDQLNSKLSQLKAGELNGVLSPASANVKIQLLAKQYASIYPHLTDKIQTLVGAAQGYVAKDSGGGSGGGGGGPDNIFDKTDEDIFHTAAMQGYDSPQEYLADLRKQRAAKDKKEEIDTLQSNGLLEESHVADWADQTISVAQEKLGQGYMNLLKSGGLKSNVMLVSLTQAKQDTTNLFLRALDARERDPEHPVKFSKEFRDSIAAKAAAMYDPWIAIAPHIDSTDNALRLSNATTKIMENKNIRSYNEALGVLAPIVTSPGGMQIMQAFAPFAAQLGSANTSDKQASQLNNIALRAKNGDMNAYLFLAMKDRLPKLSADSVAAHATPGAPIPKPTGIPQIDNFVKATVIKTLTDPKVPMEQKREGMGKIIHSGDFEGISRSTVAQDIIKTTPALQSQFDVAVPSKVARDISELDPSTVKDIYVDPSDTNAPFKSTYYQNMARGYDPNVGDASTGLVSNGYRSQAYANTLNSLNQAYRIMSTWKGNDKALTEVTGHLTEAATARIHGFYGTVEANQPDLPSGSFSFDPVKGFVPSNAQDPAATSEK